MAEWNQMILKSNVFLNPRTNLRNFVGISSKSQMHTLKDIFEHFYFRKNCEICNENLKKFSVLDASVFYDSLKIPECNLFGNFGCSSACCQIDSSRWYSFRFSRDLSLKKPKSDKNSWFFITFSMEHHKIIIQENICPTKIHKNTFIVSYKFLKPNQNEIPIKQLQKNPWEKKFDF